MGYSITLVLGVGLDVVGGPLARSDRILEVGAIHVHPFTNDTNRDITDENVCETASMGGIEFQSFRAVGVDSRGGSRDWFDSEVWDRDPMD